MLGYAHNECNLQYKFKKDTVHSGLLKFLYYFADGVTSSLYIREHCCKVSAKTNDRYPPANAILCLHLNNLRVSYVAIRGSRQRAF